MNYNSQKIYPTGGYEQLQAAGYLQPNPQKGYNKLGRPQAFTSRGLTKLLTKDRQKRRQNARAEKYLFPKSAGR